MKTLLLATAFVLSGLSFVPASFAADCTVGIPACSGHTSDRVRDNSNDPDGPTGKSDTTRN